MTDQYKPASPDSPRSDHPSLPSAEPYNPDRSISEFDSFEYYPGENKYRAFYDAGQSRPSTAVVSAVAAVSDTDPLEMNPLYTTIDPDALDAVASRRRTADGDLHVTFAFHGHEVTMSDYGCITIQPQSAPRASPAADD